MDKLKKDAKSKKVIDIINADIDMAVSKGQIGTPTMNIGDEFEMNQFAKLEKKLKITVYPKEIYGGKVLAPRMD